ncbi:MAG: type II secretion system F family protein [Nitrososphaerota archaeon]|jgi:flagellar protein FlaJ|nr:type II secretion system F family protein [Nitrososphaerota archaeon]MDG6900202.1 type II secretion system F family protein [Nitrososphaerota archaeon]MDG6912993.1 type II secretion system F family protein [Nitrososphaerota archaeon]MDG6921224.1 type II secretion system F family protein [Nitrososphaerota archaeon]MDG6937829.1 type II secretion system F family protein [Nitrososphaerota archaeon]
MAQMAVTEVKPSDGQKLTLTDRISAFSLRIFGRPARRISKSMPGLREDILKSNLRTTPDALVSLALFSFTMTGVVAAALVVVAFATGFLLLALAVVALPFALLLGLNAPKISQSTRASALENELPFLVGYMEVLAGGGVSPVATLKRIAKMEKLLPASSKEAKLILVDTDVFGVDPITALEKAADHNPNKTFREFLYGYTTVLKTGGDAQTYVNSKLKETMDARSLKIRRTSDTIGTMAEAYITVTAVLGISLFTLYQVQAIVSHNNAGITSLLMFSFVLVPIISAMFVWLLDGLGTKQPYTDYRPYKIFGVFAPLGAALFFVPLPLNLVLRSTISLLTAVVVPAVFAIRYSRERYGLETKLPDFIRDVAESRKIGLSPEASIETLEVKSYGRLSKPVEKMGAQLSWGLTLSKVVTTFIGSVNSWLTKVVGSLMLEVVDVGGGTVRSFSEMADFTRRINDLEAEKRSALRPYIFVTYMAGIMIVMTTFLMVYFLKETTLTPGTLAQSTVSSGTVDLLLVSALFESFVVGLVAGKMGEGALSDGFKHSMVLVIISVVTVYVAALFIKIPL